MPLPSLLGLRPRPNSTFPDTARGIGLKELGWTGESALLQPWLDGGKSGRGRGPRGPLGFNPAARGRLPGRRWEMPSVYNLVSWETDQAPVILRKKSAAFLHRVFAKKRERLLCSGPERRKGNCRAARVTLPPAPGYSSWSGIRFPSSSQPLTDPQPHFLRGVGWGEGGKKGLKAPNEMQQRNQNKIKKC